MSAPATVHTLHPQDAAIALARRGFKVFPLRPDNKKPRGDMAQWQDKATSDPQQIRALWKTEPRSNVAVLMGDRIVAIDLDVKGGLNGITAFKELAAKHCVEATPTLNAITPSGGRHLFYSVPEGVRIGTSAGRLGKGIDVRGVGGYVVGAGSCINGKAYRWNNPAAEVAPLPDWLRGELVAITAEKPDEPVQHEPHALAVDDIRGMLAHIKTETYDDWCGILWALRGSEQDGLALLELADEWSREQPGYVGPDDVREKYQQGNGQLTVGTLWKLAVTGGWVPTADQTARLQPPVDAEKEFDVLPPLTPEQQATAEKLRTTNPAASARLVPSPNRVLTAAEFAGELSPRQHRIKGLLLMDAELNLIYGSWGTGKSFLALDIAAAIHRGVPWNGKRVTRGRVVYVVAEGRGDFKYRTHAYAKAHGLSLTDLPALVPHAPNLLDDGVAQDVIAQIKTAGGVDVLVIDTLSATAPGGNENSSETMGCYLHNVSAIGRHFGAQVIVIAHPGKDEGKGVRGWSGIGAALDTQLHVTKLNGIHTVETTKAKGGADGGTFNFALDFVPLGIDEDGDDFGSCVVRYLEGPPPSTRAKRAPRGINQVAVYEQVPEYQPASLAEVIAAALPHVAHNKDTKGLRAARSNLRRALNELGKAGLVHVHDGAVSRTAAVPVAAAQFDAAPAP